MIPGSGPISDGGDGDDLAAKPTQRIEDAAGASGDGAASPPMPMMSGAGTAPGGGASFALPVIEGYEILKTLSRGGQGVVYLAMQCSTQRKVAIKILLDSWAHSPAAQQRFQREVELVAQLKHPNIITIFDSGVTADGRLYYVMDYVRGQPITRFVRDRRLDLETALTLFASVCDAVSHAHQRGVIHRDLKPSNILVDGEGQVHLLDFGLAKATAAPDQPMATASGDMLGTPAYMSPEQAVGKHDLVDTRSDVYCLGVILYELLTGQFPYPVDGAIVETARHIESTDPPAPSAAWMEKSGIAGPPGASQTRCPLDDEVDTIVIKTLAKERDRRYQSAGELARDVRHYLAGRPIEARRDSTFYILRKTLVRYRGAVIAAALFIALLATSSVVFYVQRQEARTARAQAVVDRDRARDAELEAQKNQRLAERRLVESLLAAGNGRLSPGHGFEARYRFLQAWDLQAKLGDAEFGALAGMLASYAISPPPLMGDEGIRAGIGGFEGHQGAIGAVAMLADGRRALSAGVDRTIRLWDVLTGREVRRYHGHAGTVRALAMLPDGRRFVSASLDGTLKAWTIDSGEVAVTFADHQCPVHCVCITPDGACAISGGADGIVRVWDVGSGVQRAQFDCAGQRISHVAVSRDGALLLASSAGTARVWNLKTKAAETSLQLDAAQFLPDATQVLGATPDMTGNLVLLNRESGQSQRLYSGHSGWVSRLRLSPEGKLAFSSSTDRLVYLWSVATGQALQILGGHLGAVGDVDFAAEAPVAISGGADATLKLWDLRSPPVDVPAWRGHQQPPLAVAFSTDGRLALSGAQDGAVRLWDVSTGKAVWMADDPEQPVECVVFSGDGSRIACSTTGGMIWVWDLTSRRAAGAAATTRGSGAISFQADAGPVLGLAFASDGTSLVASGPSGMPRTWDIATRREIRRLDGPKVRTTAMAVNREANRLAVACADQVVRLFRLSDLSPEGTLRAQSLSGLRSMAFSPDGSRLAAGDWNGQIWLFDIASQKALFEMSSPLVIVYGVGFVDGGKHIACAGADRTLRLLDATSGQLVQTFRAHDQPVLGLATWENRVLTAGQDNVLRLWDFDRPRRYRQFDVDLPAARRALEQDERDPAALASFAQWHALRENHAWALELFERARAGGGSVSPLALARLYWQLGQVQKAREQFEAALGRNEAPQLYLRLCIEALERPRPATVPMTSPATSPATRPMP